ncbi:MAG: aminopeptidase [Gemmatimonadota bacterium]|nr:aminopeptidase [Gemmatimonadota bacterium]
MIERDSNATRLRSATAWAGVAIGLISTACSPTYVLRAGWEEARILSSRRPIHAVVHDTTVALEVRQKLRLVLDARDFAVRDLGLHAGRSYDGYAEITRDTLALNVVAAPEFELRWKTWWFPIVGHVPYKGFFDFDHAFAEAERLEADGYDVTVRPVSAFSTLGWFPDPVMSTTLRLDSLALVETVIHEITHTTFFPTGEADFNESFANFVGYRGAIAFFCEALGDESLCDRAVARWDDTRVFGEFFHSLLEPLNEVFAADLQPDDKRARKRAVFEEASTRFDEDVRPRLRAGRYGSIDPESVNNAWVISRLLYYTRLDDFEAVYGARGDLPAAIAAIISEAADGDPWSALDRLLPAATREDEDP